MINIIIILWLQNTDKGLHVDQIRKTYDAVVGDITILSKRSKYVEFTQPYTESGLTMVIPAKSNESPWMFTKPFTWGVWLVVAFILIYTMFIVWFLEHQSNPEFKGSLKDQIATAMWFAFCSLFFAHSKYKCSIIGLRMLCSLILKREKKLCSLVGSIIISLHTLLGRSHEQPICSYIIVSLFLFPYTLSFLGL